MSARGSDSCQRAMARMTGTPVVGIERSAEQIREAMAQARAAGRRTCSTCGKATRSACRSPRASGGRSMSRMPAICSKHVPDPLAVVRTMVVAVRPGGRVILEDDDHEVMRLWPQPPGFSAVWQAYMRGYDRLGNDPIVGRRLVQLLAEAGARPRRNTWIFFGSCAGHPDFDDFVTNLAGVLEGAMDVILTMGLTRDQVEDTLEALDRWRERPDAAIWYAIAWAEAVRPAR